MNLFRFFTSKTFWHQIPKFKISVKHRNENEKSFTFFVDEIFRLTLCHGFILRPNKIRERERENILAVFRLSKSFQSKNFYQISQTCIDVAIWRFCLHLFSIFPSSDGYNSSDVVPNNNLWQLFRGFFYTKIGWVSFGFFEEEKHWCHSQQVTYRMLNVYLLPDS